MKILFLTPYDNNYRYRSAFSKSLSYMPLTMPYLAALTPEEYHAEFRAVDEGVQKVNYEKMDSYDIVAITAVTSSVKRGYELAELFRRKGSYIVMGGHHVTLLPDEAAQHADTVLTGPADRVWREFIADFASGAPKKRYDGQPCDIGTVNVIPRRDLMAKRKYIGVPTVIANFGCTNKCEFCVINSFWGGRHTARKVEDVIDEIRSLGKKRILFLDPSPTSNRVYAKAFYEALIPLKIKWAGLCTTDIYRDEELFDLMIRSGCIGILMGFETFSEESLKESNKRNKVEQYKAVVEKFHQSGVTILGTFMIGFDGDTRESIRKMPDYIEEIGVDIPRFAILTPYPNTPTFERLDAEGRILSRDWNDYDSIHATFQPKNCTAQELEEMLVEVSNECYTFKRIRRRALRNKYGGLIKFAVNIGFRMYNKKVAKTLAKH
ncbi:MAG: B12-binding domain-containing radical SAM protein [Lachnospiraceae bacterium]|nr:B12-binding domain-containing radical SAM protein [Lachnospiraceae bacterium]